MRDKVFGVIYGTAIGDALGYAVEFKHVKPSEPVVGPDAVPKLYSDDTQMMRAVFEGMLRWSGNDPLVNSLQRGTDLTAQVSAAAEEVGEEFIAWAKSPENNRSPGNACMSGCYYLELGRDWNKCGSPSAGGCGAAIRSQAYGVFFHADPGRAATWAAEHALMTHGSRMAQASAAAVAAGVAAAMSKPRNPARTLTAMLEASQLWDEETHQMLCDASQSKDASADTILDQWKGWAGHEAVAASLWCLLRHPDDFERAVLTAVNSPGDSDSLGAITGALMGARLGISGIPKRWVQQVEDSAGLEVLASRVCKRLGL